MLNMLVTQKNVENSPSCLIMIELPTAKGRGLLGEFLLVLMNLLT